MEIRDYFRRMEIRPRCTDDTQTLVTLADAVRRVDRWPPHRIGPAGSFLFGQAPIAAFVAEHEGLVIGHVAVHERSAGNVMTTASEALGIDQSNLAVIARLFVAPAFRGLGTGLKLLDVAAQAASSAHRHPILDVWTELAGAISLYERAGWRRLCGVNFTFSQPCGRECLHSGDAIQSFVYAAPRVAT